MHLSAFFLPQTRFFAGRLDFLPIRVYNNTEPVYRDYYLIV